MKNIIILMLFLASSAFASSGSSSDYFFLVDNTVMVDAYYNIFNAMASIFSSDSYYDILKLAFLMGGFFVFAGGIIATIGQGSAPTSATGTVAGFGKYYIASTALLVILFSVKSTMWVSTNNIPTFCTVTSPGSATTGQAIEMPSVLAFAFSSTNLLGRELTNLAEAAFSEPSSTGQTTMFDQGGFAGAVNNAMKIINLDPNKITKKDYGVGATGAASVGLDFNTGWQIFFSKCVYEVSNNKGSEGVQRITEMEKAKDLDEWVKAFLITPFTGTTRKPGESLVDIGGQTMTCQNLYDTTLAPAIILLEQNVGCGLKTVNGGTLQILTGQPSLGASDLQGIAVQSGLIYNLSQSKKISGIGVQSAYVSGKTLAEQNQTNLATAGYMAKILPYVQMTMRAILYGFFPFVFIVIILPGGLGVLKSYGQTMAWIELWGPTAAIVNMFVNLQAESQMSDQYTSTGLTMIGATEMMSEANTIAGIAGMLYLSIPALTWLILKGSGQMLGNLTGSISSGFSKNLQTDSVNRDVSGIEKMNQANKSNREAGLDKVVSFGEAQHYEAKAMGVVGGATMSQQMVHGLDSVADSSAQKVGTDLKAAAFKKEVFETNSKVAESAAVKDLSGAISARAEQTTTGAIDSEGKANITNTTSAATATGSKAGVDTFATKAELSKMEVLTENKTINKEKAEEWGESKGSQAFVKQNTYKEAVDKLENTGYTTKEAEDLYSAADSEKLNRQMLSETVIQERTSTNEAVTATSTKSVMEIKKQNKVAKVLNLNNDKSMDKYASTEAAKEAIDKEASVKDAEFKGTVNEKGELVKENVKKWGDNKAGQQHRRDLAHKVEIDRVKNDRNISENEAVKAVGETDGEQGFRDTETKRKTQRIDQETETNSRSGKNIKDIIENEGKTKTVKASLEKHSTDFVNSLSARNLSNKEKLAEIGAYMKGDNGANPSVTEAFLDVSDAAEKEENDLQRQKELNMVHTHKPVKPNPRDIHSAGGPATEEQLKAYSKSLKEYNDYKKNKPKKIAEINAKFDKKDEEIKTHRQERIKSLEKVNYLTTDGKGNVTSYTNYLDVTDNMSKEDASAFLNAAHGVSDGRMVRMTNEDGAIALVSTNKAGTVINDKADITTGLNIGNNSKVDGVAAIKEYTGLNKKGVNQYAVSVGTAIGEKGLKYAPLLKPKK